MFYRHLHAESCELSRVGEEAPKSELQALRDERDRLRSTIRTLCSSGNRLLDDLIGRSDAAESFKYHVKQAQAALTPAGQRWTREKPTVEGWYWLVEDGWGGPEVVLVKSVNLSLRVYFTSGRREDVGTVNAEWYGPIQRPLTPNEATE